MTILRTTELTKTFGKGDDAHTVLHDIDLAVEEREFVAIMGPSGSGKSTLLYNISGMDRPTSGTVTVDGTELTALSEKELTSFRLHKVGFVFQQPNLLKNLDLLDNVVLPAAQAKALPRRDVVARARELMDQAGVAQLARHDVTQASGGQLQRVGICRALINQPRVLFGDEPTGALDSTSSVAIMDLFAELHGQGTTVVLVTHDVKVAARAERVLYLIDGRIVGDHRHDPAAPADARAAHLTTWMAGLAA